MINTISFIRKYITVIAAALLLSAAALPLSASADCSGNTGSKDQVLKGIQDTGTDCSKNGEQTLTHGVLQIVSYIAGIVAVIMIVLAGFRYVTSGGDSGKVSSAKGALVGALIGMVIVVAAQFLVHFVLANA